MTTENNAHCLFEKSISYESQSKARIKTSVIPGKENDPCADKFPMLHTIKYSGCKSRLLPIIVWLVKQVVKPGGTVLDLMAGTHCVGYALKQQYQIYANDIQEYSYIIGKAYIKNGGYSVNGGLAEKDLLSSITRNNKAGRFDLFQKAYADTYFTESQCIEIDNIRAAVDEVPSPRKELYLTTLMSAMCYASNSTGHFAEFLSKKPPEPKSVQDLFFKKCGNISVVANRYENDVFNTEHRAFLDGTNPRLTKIVGESDLLYVDPPYSPAQYSRFYHVLETLVKYDYPSVEFKGRYRKDRYFSAFCRKSEAQSELDNTLKMCSKICRGFVLLSYVDSKSCIIPKDRVEEIVQSHFKHATKPLAFEVSHSKLGNGVSKEVTEYFILATDLAQGKEVASKLNSHYAS